MAEKSPTADVPDRYRWFAVWAWKQWKRRAACLLLLFNMIAYPLSIGPAMYLADSEAELRFVAAAYRPVFWVYHRLPAPARGPCFDYAEWWAGFFTFVFVDGVATGDI